MYKMCDRAGVISSCNSGNGAYGNNYGQFANNAYNRCNDTQLVRKELHYVETYARTRDVVNSCNNAGSYGNNCGNYNNFNNCGAGYRSCGPACGPAPCGPIGCGPAPCGPVGCGPAPCGPVGCGPAPCGPVNGPYDGPRDGPHIRRERPEKKDDDDDNDKDDGKPCNPFCKSHQKPIHNNNGKPCECRNCRNSYKKIYKNSA